MNDKCTERTAKADISSWKYLEENMSTELQSSPWGEEKKKKVGKITETNTILKDP